MKKGLLFLLTLALLSPIYGQIINEVVYDPDGPNDGSSTAGEWIELYCEGPGACDASCMVITDGDWTVQIPDGTSIPAGGFYVIGKATYATATVDLDVETCACTTGSNVMELTNSGEAVGLYDATGTLLDGVIYESPSAGNDPGGVGNGGEDSAGAGGCPVVTADIEGNAAAYVSVGSGGDNGIARDLDGGTWGYIDFLDATPGETNEEFLSIDLVDFTVTYIKSTTVQLDWATAQEIDNEYFSIEHSTTGRDFKEIDFVKGAGTSTSKETYQFKHDDAVVGANYYRLRQVDFDGTSTISKVEVVTVKGAKTINAWPTVATSQISIVLSEASTQDQMIEVYNIIGNKVLTAIVESNQTAIELDIADLDNGSYFIRIESGDEMFITRFVKQ